MVYNLACLLKNAVDWMRSPIKYKYTGVEADVAADVYLSTSAGSKESSII